MQASSMVTWKIRAGRAATATRHEYEYMEERTTSSMAREGAPALVGASSNPALQISTVTDDQLAERLSMFDTNRLLLLGPGAWCDDY